MPPSNPSAPAPKKRFDEFFPPPKDRACVKCGIAVVDPDGQIRYDWHAVGAQWQADPETNFHKFCNRYHLPYVYAKQQVEINADDKRAAQFRSTQTYKLALLTELAVRRSGQIDEDASRISDILSGIEQLASAGVKYAKARLVKVVNGELVVNPLVSPSEVKKVMEIGMAAAFMLRTAMQLGQTIPNESEPERVPAPQSLPPGMGFQFPKRPVGKAS